MILKHVNFIVFFQNRFIINFLNIIVQVIIVLDFLNQSM